MTDAQILAANSVELYARINVVDINIANALAQIAVKEDEMRRLQGAPGDTTDRYNNTRAEYNALTQGVDRDRIEKAKIIQQLPITIARETQLFVLANNLTAVSGGQAGGIPPPPPGVTGINPTTQPGTSGTYTPPTGSNYVPPSVNTFSGGNASIPPPPSGFAGGYSNLGNEVPVEKKKGVAAFFCIYKLLADGSYELDAQGKKQFNYPKIGGFVAGIIAIGYGLYRLFKPKKGGKK